MFKNTEKVLREEVRGELGGQFGNETVNKTYVIVEYHPTSQFDEQQCQVKCAEFNCTCAHLITNSRTYRDGTCVAIGKAYFLETYSALEAPENYTTALLVSAYKFRSWETVNYESPLIFNKS